MEKVELSPEERLIAAIFGEEQGKVIEEVSLTDKIKEVLETLSPREKRVLELRFGLEDGRLRTLEEIGQEFGVTKERIRQIEGKALRKLRHPSRSRRLEKFLISPTEPTRTEVENEQLWTRIQRLATILERLGIKEEDFEGLKTVELVIAVEELKKDWEEFVVLAYRFPNNRVWNALRRAGINRLSELKKRMKTGNVRGRGLGEKAEEFLEQVLQNAKQKASP